ncbi:MAG: hypothetical protein A3H32_13110 [Betaproteobacteria bacterium RIFCSPLOWO2_02_FULL_63_19]|nr:MAG: hypothetical protein A3H32_13110 [Betaproteobacteria bacterium RIFCSPLOWO2_02_FULL_63_19]
MLLLARTVEPEVPRGSGKSILGDFVDGRKYARGHFGIFNVLIFTALMGLLLRPLPAPFGGGGTRFDRPALAAPCGPKRGRCPRVCA